MVSAGNPHTPTLEEILASIRRITSEESAPELMLHWNTALLSPHQVNASADDLNFELPAMFRQDRAVNAQPPDQVFNPFDALSSYNPSLHSAPTPAPPPPIDQWTHKIQTHQIQTAPDHASEVPREMSACRDSMALRMSQPNAAEPKPVAPSLVRDAIPVPKAALRVNYLVGAGSFMDMEPPDLRPQSGPTLPDRPGDNPATIANSTDAHEPTWPGATNDADLLRPLLRQWLDDNISRMLTQALMDTVKSNEQRS